jgi:signal transduction histidine kinase
MVSEEGGTESMLEVAVISHDLFPNFFDRLGLKAQEGSCSEFEGFTQ